MISPSTKDKRMLVPMCCEFGLHLKNSQCKFISGILSRVKFPPLYSLDLQPSNKTLDDFFTITWNPCEFGSFAIDPEEDIFFFLDNGQILTKNVTYPALIDQSHYCLAITLNHDKITSKTIVAVCLPPDSNEIPKIYSIFHLISSIFLIATFIVYNFLPHLQNIHRNIVKTYVLILGIAYFALAVTQFGGQLVISQKHLCCSLGKYI